MRGLFRAALGAAALALGAAAAPAQSVLLAESVGPGDVYRVELALSVSGVLKVDRQGKLDRLPLTATATHSFVEAVEAPDAQGGVGVSLRHYQNAVSESDVGGDRARRELAPGRRLIVAKRTANGSLLYSPDGPLAREELELVAEHFDTLALPALLPGKEVKPGDTWPLSAHAAQHACLFEGLIKNELVGTCTEIAGGNALFTITGQAEGVEFGARAVVAVRASGRFDLTSQRIVELNWEQTDRRDQGPANPASEIKATVTLKRGALSSRPAEVGDAARAKLPADGKVPELQTALRYADPAGRYTFLHARGWHVVGRTRDHLVLRLLENGEFTAQATITGWRKSEPGRPTPPEEFKAVLAKLPGWEPEAVLAERDVPTDPGRRLFVVACRGKQDGQPVVQLFYLLSGAAGDQVAVTVVSRPDKAEALSPKDLMLVNAIEFPAAGK